MADFGYDISDHTAVDPGFGTLADADALIARAHELGLRVLFDFVPNHTSDRHPWFEESRVRRPSRRSWYVWRPGRWPPNNWVSSFGRAAPRLDARRAHGQWYLHSFLPEQPDLNWDEPAVAEAMHDVLRFWLRRGVDGFRIDVAHKIGKDPALGDNEPGRRHDEDWPSVHPRSAQSAGCSRSSTATASRSARCTSSTSARSPATCRATGSTWPTTSSS